MRSIRAGEHAQRSGPVACASLDDLVLWDAHVAVICAAGSGGARRELLFDDVPVDVGDVLARRGARDRLWFPTANALGSVTRTGTLSRVALPDGFLASGTALGGCRTTARLGGWCASRGPRGPARRAAHGASAECVFAAQRADRRLRRHAIRRRRAGNAGRADHAGRCARRVRDGAVSIDGLATRRTAASGSSALQRADAAGGGVHVHRASGEIAVAVWYDGSALHGGVGNKSLVIEPGVPGLTMTGDGCAPFAANGHGNERRVAVLLAARLTCPVPPYAFMCDEIGGGLSKGNGGTPLEHHRPISAPGESPRIREAGVRRNQGHLPLCKAVRLVSHLRR